MEMLTNFLKKILFVERRISDLEEVNDVIQ